jgi:hypothetical protein
VEKELPSQSTNFIQMVSLLLEAAPFTKEELDEAHQLHSAPPV